MLWNESAASLNWWLIRLQRIYNFYYSMLLYYHSWMFYNHFIATLYHFFGLTYWPNAQCQLVFFACLLHRRKSIPNGVQTQRNFLWIFWDQKTPNGPEKHLGVAPRGHNPPGRDGPPGAPRWVVPTSVASRTTSLLYKYPNILETLGESTKINSIRRKFQKPHIQSKHHHGGVHHPHWCLSDDSWVVHCRPTSP